MLDLASINGILTGIKTATDIAKSLREIDISLEKAETKLKLAELIGALADAKMSIADIQLLLEEKDKEIFELKKNLEIKTNVVYEKPSYWLVNGDKKDGPFCQKCYDDNHKLVRLQGGKNDYWTCSVCKEKFKGVGYVPYGGTYVV